MKLLNSIKQFFCNHPVRAHDLQLVGKDGTEKYYDVICGNCGKLIFEDISNIAYDAYIKDMKQ
jgi:hypothetical protein